MVVSLEDKQDHLCCHCYINFGVGGLNVRCDWSLYIVSQHVNKARDILSNGCLAVGTRILILVATVLATIRQWNRTNIPSLLQLLVQFWHCCHLKMEQDKQIHC